jgi:putative ABC transport system permease protein
MLGGIACGVALIAALGVINASVLVNFRTMLERAAGKAGLQVALGTGEVGFDEANVAVVARDPDVRAAFGLVRGTLAATDGSGDALQLYGIDFVSDAADSYGVEVIGRNADEIELLNDPTSVFLTEEYARRKEVAVGDRMRFATPTGVTELHVRGLLRTEGIATVFGGNLAVMDVAAAQRLLGKDQRVDQIDVILGAGARTAAVERRLTAALPGSLTVTRPALRGERFERAIAAFQAMLDSLSLLCLLAGIFIVYNTSATAVTQRARDLAILIAVGAERRRIFALVLIESAVVGFVASLIGIAVGYGLAHVLLSFVAQSMGIVYQTRFSIESLDLTWRQAAWYAALGTAGAIAAAIAPAQKASRLDPLELMRPDFRERLGIAAPSRLLPGLWLVLVACTAGAIYLEHTRRSIAWGNAGNSLWALSVVILAVLLMSRLSGLVRRVLPRLFGFDGRIAAESLTRSPVRTGVTTAVIALSLALAVAVSSVARSFRESERSWFILTGDLVVSAVATEGGWLETPLSARVGDLLRAVPGVARVETYRVLPGQAYRDERIAIVAVSPGFVDTALFRRQVVTGEADAAVGALATGRGVLISDNLMDRFRLGPGDTLTLPTPAGVETFPVAGVVAADYSGDHGSVILGRDQFARLWSDTQVSHFNVYLAPGAPQEEVRGAVVRALAPHHLVKVLTVPQTLAYHQNMVDRAFAFTYAIQLLVVAVTLAGIFDLLTTQILERRQEIGIFRALGADDERIGRAIRLEALVIGGVGGLLGCVLGVGTSLLWVHVNFRILIGYILEHHLPVVTVAWCVALAAGFAMLAGHLAAQRALRQPVLDTLSYE